jgi:hypothetical protein
VKKGNAHGKKHINYICFLNSMRFIPGPLL